MIKGLGGAIAGSYRVAWELFATASALWIGVALLELLQHAVEWHLGMFVVGDGIEAGSESRIRMGFGLTKVAAAAACTYLVPRFLYQDRDWKRVRRLDKTFLRGVAVVAGIAALGIAIPAVLAWAANVIYLMDPWVAAIWGQGLGLLLTIPFMALFPWGIGLIAGDHAMTLRRSVRAMHRRWIWATLLLLACAIPPMVLHVALNEIAVGTSSLALGAILLLDSVLVGFIALILGSSSWTIYYIRVLEAPRDQLGNRHSPAPVEWRSREPH